MNRLNNLSSHLCTALAPPNHPLDPLSTVELAAAVKIIKRAYPGRQFSFNTVTLREPRKVDMTEWLKTPAHHIPREVYFVILETGTPGLIDGYLSLTDGQVKLFNHIKDAQPILTASDLSNTEKVVRTDPLVIEQCRISGIPAEDMHKVFCDPWTVGFDEKYGNSRRLQQAIMYYRSDPDDFQYSHALDFCPIIDTELKKVLYVKIPKIRRPLSQAPHPNFYPKDIEAGIGFRKDIKPIKITQPEGVSFKMNGNVISWQNFEFHIGVNYREGLVLSNVRYYDKFEGRVRPIFRRLSMADMIVPYGHPGDHHPHKLAIDIGEYGFGNCVNPLGLGCDCVGKIHYLDWSHVLRDGSVSTIKNAICIHEEDNGLLFKHADFRDEFQTSLVARARKLVVSQIATVGNYTYCFYWNFHQDATISLDVKLTGILNTYVANPDEKTEPYGTKVYPGVNAQNHQHMFCLRLDPEIDGSDNSVAMVDGARSTYPVGHPENKYGNAFFPERTVFKTAKESMVGYDGSRSRTWDIFNPNKVHPFSGKPVSYKIVSRDVPDLLPKDGGIVARRGAFAKHAIHVVPYKDDQLYPAGQHVPQTSGFPPAGLPEWIGEGNQNIENTDIVVFHTFGITHFPASEDFPIMPAEPITLLLRPRNFFLMNPAMDVPPSYAITASEVRAQKSGNQAMFDKGSQLAFGNAPVAPSSDCCK
ncbi:uncharacterized protein SAPINGB_P004383 [Magnusiomyces paraingens]|uniref:Amine oxidase n=1 Tax=Magnusiomyces paraingens TaxID=2606893 RepID=A0A5E8BTK2_9ASCO|nr:uncharacterized protein SAPINGB_P004383 [Saprochaete ingens]VVT55028.1 unnamed protein product [Saprochaete ingens]